MEAMIPSRPHTQTHKYRPCISSNFTNNNSMPYYQYTCTFRGPGGMRLIEQAAYTPAWDTAHRPSVLYSMMVKVATVTIATQVWDNPTLTTQAEPRPTEYLWFPLFKIYLKICTLG